MVAQSPEPGAHGKNARLFTIQLTFDSYCNTSSTDLECSRKIIGKQLRDLSANSDLNIFKLNKILKMSKRFYLSWPGFLNSNTVGNSRATGLSVEDCCVSPSLNKVEVDLSH